MTELKPGQYVGYGSRGYRGRIIALIKNDDLAGAWYQIRRTDGVVLAVSEVDVRPDDVSGAAAARGSAKKRG